jgi:hypothetical protein
MMNNAYCVCLSTVRLLRGGWSVTTFDDYRTTIHKMDAFINISFQTLHRF